MKIKKIVSSCSEEALGKALDSVPVCKIACVNWQEYPYCPEVLFTAAHDGGNLYLKYYVTEQSVRASVDEDNGKVSNDSCVEFFVSFDDTGYYNFEFNCIGKVLLGFRKESPNVIRASTEMLSGVKRFPSLGTEPFEEIRSMTEWNLSVVIPKEAFFRHNITDFSGIKVKANLYKCGDGLSVPHFLSWKPIFSEKPNFHLPQFFSAMEFE